MTLYFDPMTTVHSNDHNAFRGRWEDRLWLNVPGPFYGGETDTCWTGRLAAPAHVLYGGKYLTEYVYRQPRTPTETALLVDAAGDDPFGGYGCDGDSRWTPETVREWWRNRGQVLQYLSDQRRTWDESDAAQGQDIAAAVRDFESYIGGGLASDLQIYLYWLEKRQSPAPGDQLPEL